MRFSSYRFNDGLTRNRRRFCGLNPTSTCRRFWSVRRKRPAPTSSTSEMATCTMSSDFPRQAARAHHAAAGLLERRAHVHSRTAECRGAAEDEARQAGDGQDEEEDAPIERRQLAGRAGQQLLAPVADEDAKRSTHRREQQALGQKLPDQPRRASRPSESRTESSFCRVVARDSSRFATLAQTISRTSATTTLRIVTERSSFVLTS